MNDRKEDRLLGLCLEISSELRNVLLRDDICRRIELYSTVRKSNGRKTWKMEVRSEER